METTIQLFRKVDKGPMTGKLVVIPINPDTLFFDDKTKVLEAVNLIKNKYVGK